MNGCKLLKLPPFAGVSPMSVDRSRRSFAVPKARRRESSRRGVIRLRGLVSGAAVLAALGGSAVVSAQFPPPARPPKVATEGAKPQDARAAAPLPSARSILD